MANTSILAAFERMWQHVTAALGNKSDLDHTHDDLYYTEAEVDEKLGNKSNKDHTHTEFAPITRLVNGKELSSDVILNASDVGALPEDTEIPSTLAELASDAEHRTVTEDEKAIWFAKSEFSGNYNDLENKPEIPSIEGLATMSYVDSAIDSAIDVNLDESIIGLEVDGQVITYIKGDGSRHTIVTQDTDTTYTLATDEVTGLTKLYAVTGNAEDGTMTQKAIKTELDKKVGVSIDEAQNTLVFTK